MPLLPGLHDIEATAIAAPDTWILDTVALSDNPQPKSYPTSLNVIARLNWGYGSTGTLPVPDQYNSFSRRVAQYVDGSSGCTRWQIGNEPNLRREWPDLIPIYPWHYAACYKLCRDAIHALPGHQADEVLIAASGPWNDELKYEGNPNGDWITYFEDVVRLCGQEIDGFSLHAYTHGYDPALVTSTARMNAPFYNRYYEFYTYRDYCAAIPPAYRHLPAYICEANGNGPWQAVGLMPAMLREIDGWNKVNKPAIHCVTFYRYSTADENARFAMSTKPDVMAEYHGAVELGLQSPAPTPPRPTPPGPQPPRPTPPAPDAKREIDPALIARGVTFEFVTPLPGTGYWRLVKAEWLDEAEADAVGPDHHILGTIQRDGQEVAGVPFLIRWPTGSTTILSKPNDPVASYNYNFPMSASLNEFAITVADDEASDIVRGIGMGMQGNPAIHTSTWLAWEWTIAEVTPPLPSHTEYVTPLIGANVRAEPSEESAKLYSIPYAEAVSVTGLTNGYEGEEWKDVTYLEYDGFIRGDLLSVQQPEPILPPEPPGALGLIWPVQRGVITQWFGDPDSDIDYRPYGSVSHDGIDIGAPEGTPVLCVANGKVMVVGNDPDGFGLFVRIYHSALGFHSLYAHLAEQSVKAGEMVSQGRQIGSVGSSGNSTGNHLHLSFRVGAENDYWQLHSGHPQGACDPLVAYAVINRSDPNLIIP